MQVTLKQSEITAAIAAYLTNVLGVSNVAPETLSVVYKQGRSDKNGMTAELDIEAPAYERPKQFVPSCAAAPEVLTTKVLGEDPALGNVGASSETPTETTSVSAAQAPEAAPAEVAVEPEPTGLVYDGERRSEERSELVDGLPEAEPEPEVEVPVELDEVAQALAEDAAAEAAEEPAAEPKAEALFG